MVDFDLEQFKADVLEGVTNAAQSVSTAAKSVSSDVKRLKRFRETGRDLFVSGAVTSHGGNISETDGKSIWITRTESMLGRITSSTVVETGWNEDARDFGASIELVVHRAIYHALAGENKAPDSGADAQNASQEKGGEVVAAIIHAHPAHTIAYSLDHSELRPLDAEGTIVLGEEVKILKPKETVASPEVASMMAEAVSAGARIAIIAGHGPFAVAPDLESAFKLVSCLERSAQILNARPRS